MRNYVQNKATLIFGHTGDSNFGLLQQYSVFGTSSCPRPTTKLELFLLFLIHYSVFDALGMRTSWLNNLVWWFLTWAPTPTKASLNKSSRLWDLKKEKKKVLLHEFLLIFYYILFLNVCSFCYIFNMFISFGLRQSHLNETSWEV